MRASDAEREAVTERLRDAAAEGRLTLEELADRSGAAYGATSHAELEQLTADLPESRVATPPAHADRRARRWFLGIMGGDTVRGHTRLAGSCTIVNLMGGVDLDLSQATLEDGALTLRVISIMGGSTIRVPPGVHVDRSGLSIMGGDTVKVGDPPPPDAPVVSIRVFNLMGGNKIKQGRPRPGRWPWVERAGEPPALPGAPAGEPPG